MRSPNRAVLCVPIGIVVVLLCLICSHTSSTLADLLSREPRAQRGDVLQVRPDPSQALLPVFDNEARDPAANKLGPDLLFLYGRPGSNEGSFETLTGQPDWQGWVSVDRNATLLEDNHWHVYDPMLPPPSVTLTPSNQSREFGRSLVRVDSLAGDDRVTLVAGTYSNLSGTGSIRIYFGEDVGLAAPTWTTFQGEEGYGSSLADMGDIDGDGDHELLVGASSTSGSGAAYAYFGEPGVGLNNTAPDLTILPPVSAGSFGRHVAGIGDFNGDGYDDWVITAGKKLYAYFGAATPDATADLELSFTVFGYFGWSIAGGDINGDGYSDVLVGEPGPIMGGLTSTFTGRVHIFLGSASPSLGIGNYLEGTVAEGAFGAAIVVAPPLSEGAAQDFFVGEPFASSGNGRVHRYQGGATPSLQNTWSGDRIDGHFGWSLDALPALATPGNTAFVVGEPGGAGGGRLGRAWIIVSGTDPSTQYFDGPGNGSLFGHVVVDACNALGAAPGIAVAAPAANDSSGVVEVHSLGTLGPMLYCGDESPPPEWLGGAGYGNDWNDPLGWYQDVADPGQATDVCLDLEAFIEIEESFDYLVFEYETAGGFTEWDALTGTGGPLSLHYCANYPPADYVTNPFTGNPAVHLRIRVDSDGVYSDESGEIDTVLGAALLRDLVVRYDGVIVSTASVLPDASDDSPSGLGFSGFETGGWFREEILFGDFSKLVSNFSDIDPLRENATPQVSFIDDGTPPKNDTLNRSTGGSLGSTNYGVPGNWVLNYEGGLSNGTLELLNEIHSPKIVWDDATTPDDDDYDYAVLSFDAWLDLPREKGFLYSWKVRHLPTGGGSTWSTWRGNNFIYYSYGDPHYETRQFEIGRYIPASAESIQVALIVGDYSWYLSVPGDDATPAPLFDNIRVFKQFNSTTSTETPAGSAVPVDLDDVQLEFDYVAEAGSTSVVHEVTFGQPANFYLATDPLMIYQITTTASFLDSIEVCITYDEADLVVPEAEMRMIHLEENEWVDVTRTLDLVSNTICGVVGSLSPFGLAREISATDTPPTTAPLRFALHPAYPNPFNPSTTISFSIPKASRVELDVYDLAGRHVRTLVSERLSSGEHLALWNGKDDTGALVASGVYLYQLRAADFVETRRMVLLK